MANYCDNCLTVISTTGDYQEVQRFEDMIRFGESFFDFEKIAPLKEGESAYDVWGTRGMGENCDYFHTKTDSERTYLFTTVWGPAYEWFKKAVAMFPMLNFHYEYEEEGQRILGFADASNGVITINEDYEGDDAHGLVEFGLEHLNWSGEDTERYTACLISELQEKYEFDLNVKQVFDDYFAVFNFYDDREDFVIKIDNEKVDLFTDLEDACVLDAYSEILDIINSNAEHFPIQED